MCPNISNIYFLTKMQNIELREDVYSVVDCMVRSIYGLVKKEICNRLLYLGGGR
jgi:hypothetical protein